MCQRLKAFREEDEDSAKGAQLPLIEECAQSDGGRSQTARGQQKAGEIC